VPARTARYKLLESLAPTTRDAAAGLDPWFLHDPDPWEGHCIPYGELRRIAICIRRHRQIELRFRGESDVAGVSPLGLVLKAGSWRLVFVAANGPELRVLDSLVATRVNHDRFDPPADFDLTRFWNTKPVRATQAGQP
jgi:predicted DNA-binding transcriptional regulator YafY